MPNYWILKTEPDTYSFADLRRDKRTTWDGVTNNLALKHMRAMQQGDQLLIYHTGKEKQIVGRATVARAAYPDPKAQDEKIVVVDIAAGAPLRRPVTLGEIKATRAFADLPLVRIPRLSVGPVPKNAWERLVKLGS